MNAEVRPLTEDEYPIWDSLVDESPQGTVFHKSFWLEASGRKFFIYGYFTGGELYAGISLAYSRKFGIKTVSPPFLTPYSGVIFKERTGKYVYMLTAQKEASQQIARKLKSDFHSVRFDFPVEPVDLQPFIWEGFSPSIRYTYIINLNNSLEEIWNSMSGTRRQNINKAVKDGITIIQSEDFNQTINLVERNYLLGDIKVRFDQTVSNHNVVLAERNQCKSFLAKDKEGDYIAVVYIVWDNRRSYYILGGIDSEKSHYGAVALAIWEAIKFTKQEISLEEFDFEGSMIPQIERFFREFGGHLTVRLGVTWVKPYLKLPFLVGKRMSPILARLWL